MYDYVTRSAFSIPDSLRRYAAEYQQGWGTGDLPVG